MAAALDASRFQSAGSMTPSAIRRAPFVLVICAEILSVFGPKKRNAFTASRHAAERCVIDDLHRNAFANTQCSLANKYLCDIVRRK
jgi:hypothetical protein